MFGFWNNKKEIEDTIIINEKIISSSPSEQYDIESAYIYDKITSNQIFICVENSDNN